MNNYYLSGPMTGIKNFNYPVFHNATKALRNNGYTIISPAEYDVNYCDSEMKTWGEYLSRDIKLLCEECDNLILLPKWEFSKGSRLEVFCAMQCKYRIYEYVTNGIIISNSYDYFLDKITVQTLQAYNA